MSLDIRRTAALAAIGLGLSGCVSAEQTALYSATEPGFQTVKAGAATALRGQQTVWVQSEQQAQQVNKLVKAFVDRKTLNADTAVPRACLSAVAACQRLMTVMSHLCYMQSVTAL